MPEKMVVKSLGTLRIQQQAVMSMARLMIFTAPVFLKAEIAKFEADRRQRAVDPWRRAGRASSLTANVPAGFLRALGHVVRTLAAGRSAG